MNCPACSAELPKRLFRFSYLGECPACKAALSRQLSARWMAGAILMVCLGIAAMLASNLGWVRGNIGLPALLMTLYMVIAWNRGSALVALPPGRVARGPPTRADRIWGIVVIAVAAGILGSFVLWGLSIYLDSR